MNFYEHQDRAQRRTKVIVFLFILAVVCIVVIVSVPIGFASQWNLGAVGGAALISVLIVGVATLVKLSQLRGGGRGVAEMLNGKELQRDGSNRAERRIQNIVEEMAIASGVPVPPVFIIEDRGINAFAAGWSTDDAVIGVTRGCIEQLNRDELQGVVAHEFSHISHGDMRINIRLIGMIFGIMALGITGWVLIRYIGPAILRTSSRSRSKEGAGGAGVGLAIIVFGLFLALCGAIGTFFGRLIQAAVSRQREFLADASAVQYTRNPGGIGGALRKIGEMTALKNISSAVGQCNHMFFSQAMGAMFSSHPPIQERIARVEGIDVETLGESVVNHEGALPSSTMGFTSASVNATIQEGFCVSEEHVQYARSAFAEINPILKSALENGWSARLVLFAIVTDQNKQSQQKLAGILSVDEFAEFQKLLSIVKRSNPITRVPIIDLAAPAIRTLSEEQLQAFHKNVVSTIKSDGVIDRFEWVFVSLLQKHTSNNFENRTIKTKRFPLLHYSDDISVVLSAVAYCGTANLKEAKHAFSKANQRLGRAIPMQEASACTMTKINGALKNLRFMRFVDKQLCIEACEACVTHDGVITVTEAETLRAIGDLLDCPIPMFK